MSLENIIVQIRHVSEFTTFVLHLTRIIENRDSYVSLCAHKPWCLLDIEENGISKMQRGAVAFLNLFLGSRLNQKTPHLFPSHSE